jgi:hypothetical protein
MKNLGALLFNLFSLFFNNKKLSSVDSNQTFFTLNNESEIPYDIDFRFKEDEPHIIRIRQKPPPGFVNKIAENVMIRKLTYASKIDNVLLFIEGTERKITLERSPKGIKIYGSWQGKRKYRTAQLGWVPEFFAGEISRNYPDKSMAATITMIFKPRPDKNPGMRYDIWIT